MSHLIVCCNDISNIVLKMRVSYSSDESKICMDIYPGVFMDYSTLTIRTNS